MDLDPGAKPELFLNAHPEMDHETTLRRAL